MATVCKFGKEKKGLKTPYMRGFAGIFNDLRKVENQSMVPGAGLENSSRIAL